MELKLEPEKFDKYQEALIEEITKTVMVKLIENGIEGAQMRELTTAITFSIASIIDDTAAIETDGEAVRPYLAFRSGGDLLHTGENAYMHELVYNIVKRMFDN